MLKIILALRNKQHQVEVLQPNGASQPVLGTSQPDEENRRNNVVKQWGAGSASPRIQAPEGIDVPFAQRTQTILSHQVGPELRSRLNGGMQPMSASRKNNHKKSTEPVENIAQEKPVE